jgi:hypothetical protein
MPVFWATGRRGRGRNSLTEKPEVVDVRTSIVYEHIRPATVLPAQAQSV